MEREFITLHEDRNVTLTAYVQAVGGEFGGIPKRAGSVDSSGRRVSDVFGQGSGPHRVPVSASGYQAFILRYSVGKDSVWPNPMNDYEEAMELIREKSEEWHVPDGQDRGYRVFRGRPSGGMRCDHVEKPSECGDSRLSGYRRRLCQRLPVHGRRT